MPPSISFADLGNELFGILICLLIGAIFAGLDSGVAALGEVGLKAMQDANGPNARVATRLLEQAEKVHARYLAGRILCIAFAAALAANIAARIDALAALIVGVLLVALLYGVLAEAAMTVARQRAHTIAVPLVRYLRPLEILMAPFAAPLSLFASAVLRSIPRAAPAEAADLAAREVEHVIDQGEERGSITVEQADLLRSVLEFRETVAREVMVPRTKMKGIEIGTPIRDVLRFITDEGHSRYPVYRDKIDQIAGVLTAKDLFRVVLEQKLDGTELTDILTRPVFFVAETQKVNSVLKEMQSRGLHMAIVLDEYGGVSGLVTLEDILEEIVGEIHDEHDESESPVRQLASDRYLVDATMSIYDLENFLDMPLRAPEAEYDTVNGMVIAFAGRVPEKGEMINADGFDLFVREADPRRVLKVELIRRAETSKAAAVT